MIALLLAQLACHPDVKPEDSSAEADADTDTDADSDTDSDTDTDAFTVEGGTYTMQSTPFYGDCNFFGGYYPEYEDTFDMEIDASGPAPVIYDIVCTGDYLAFDCAASQTDTNIPDTVITAAGGFTGAFSSATHVDMNVNLTYSCEGGGCADAYATYGDEMPCTLTAELTGDRSGG
jgi:hypothetical protein